MAMATVVSLTPSPWPDATLPLILTLTSHFFTFLIDGKDLLQGWRCVHLFLVFLVFSCLFLSFLLLIKRTRCSDHATHGFLSLLYNMNNVGGVMWAKPPKQNINATIALRFLYFSSFVCVHQDFSHLPPPPLLTDPSPPPLLPSSTFPALWTAHLSKQTHPQDTSTPSTSPSFAPSSTLLTHS